MTMATKHTEVYLVRHGQTDSNSRGVFHGVTDVPLNALGLRQADLVARRIRAIADLTSLHSSPLQRALRTAQAISKTTGLEPRLHRGLQEMDFGDGEGLAIAEMVTRWPELAQRFTDPEDWDARFPAGESRREFHDRVRQTLDRIVTQHTGERLLIVAHGGVIGSVVSQVLGENPNDWQRYAVDNCSVTHLELATTGPIAHLVGDTVHLEEISLLTGETTEA